MKKFKCVLAAAAIASISLVASEVSAAPFVDVRAVWAIQESDLPDGQLPEGISATCFTGGTSFVSKGCSGEALLSTQVTMPGTYSITSTGGFLITNTTTQQFDGYVLLNTYFSPFNPGGPHIGLGIDDPVTQWARFTSSVSGEGVGGFHSCAVGYLGEEGNVFSPTTCGVPSPDSSEDFLAIDLSLLAPGGSLFFPYTIEIIAEFIFTPEQPVPTPAGASLLLMGLGALYLHKSRRKKQHA